MSDQHFLAPEGPGVLKMSDLVIREPRESEDFYWEFKENLPRKVA